MPSSRNSTEPERAPAEFLQAGKFCKVAVVGATGAVGAVMVDMPESRKLPVDSPYPLAGGKSRSMRYLT